jgi:riboflavin biosynthesis pyrimidine reductase
MLRLLLPANGLPPGTGDPVDDSSLARLYQPPGDRSWLRVNFVTSVDGAVEVDGYSAGLGSAPDRRVFDLLRRYPDALLLGAGTLRHEGYGALKLDEGSRAAREERGLTGYPRLVVVSRRLDLAPTHPALADAPLRATVLTCAKAPPDRITALSAVADVVTVGDDSVDLAAGLAVLRERGLAQVLCEGGPQLFGSLTAADLVDEVCLTVSPLLAGPGAGRITAGSPTAPRGLVLRHVLSQDGVLLLRYTRPG